MTSTLRMNNQMTGVLKSVTQSMQSTLRVMESMDVASSAAFRTAKKDAAMVERAVAEFEGQLEKTIQPAEQVGNSLGGWRGDILSASAALDLMSRGVDILKSGAGISDQWTQTSARLNIINDQLQTQDELQKAIMASANRARSNYFDTADAVGQIGMNAADAFSSTKEIVAFSELLNKSFKVSGTDAQAQAGAMRQLTQAMASGVLRGDEFNSIAEQAPMIYDAIAKYMGKSKGEVRELAADGAVSADIVKAAMFAAADDIESKFAAMPRTWSDNWTLMKNNALAAFQPILNKLNELANSEHFQSFLSITTTGFQLLSIIAVGALDGISAAIAWVNDNFSLLLLGLAALGIAFLVLQGQAIASAILTFISWLAATWPILLVIAVIGIAIAILSHFGITGEQVFGAIMGAISWTIQLFKNLGLWCANVGLGIADVFMALVHNLITAFQNAGLNIKSFFLNLTSTILGFIAKIAEALNKLPFVEFDYEGLSNKATEYAQAAADAQASKGEYESIGDAWNKGMNTFDVFEKGWSADAFEQGQGWADSIGGALGDFTSGLGMDGLGSGDMSAMDYSQFGGGGNMDGGELDRVGSVGKIEDEVSISDEDIKMLRDVASMEYQLHYTQLTPQTTVQFGDVYETADVEGLFDTVISEGESALSSRLVVTSD
ncbi:MAG: tape measure protein [Oscillospiraceae bacterium]